MHKVWHTRGWVATPGAKSSLFAVDPVLRVNGQDAVGAVLAVAVIPNRLDVEAETFAANGAGNHPLVIDIKADVGDGLAILDGLVDFFLQSLYSLFLLGLNGLLDNFGADVDCQQYSLGCVVTCKNTIAKRGKLKKPGQILADISSRQMSASVECRYDHFLPNRTTKAAGDVFGKGEGFGLGSGDGHLLEVLCGLPLDQSMAYPQAGVNVLRLRRKSQCRRFPLNLDC